MMLIFSALEQAFIFFPLGLGLYLSYRILRIPDLTVEGTFMTGAALFAVLAQKGVSPVLGSLLSAFCAGLPGLAAAMMQNKGKMPPLFAGFLMIFILYSINLLIMGQPNISLLQVKTLFNQVGMSRLQLLFFLAIPVVCALFVLLKSRAGLYLRAFGCNKQLLADIGGRPFLCLGGGLFLGNVLSGLSGALFAQAGGFADINMALGVALVGIATVVMGQQIGKAFSGGLLFDLFALFASLLFYFLMQTGLVFCGIEPCLLNLCLGLFLLAAMLAAKDSILKEGAYA